MLSITIDNPKIEEFFLHSPQNLLRFIEDVVALEIEKEKNKKNALPKEVLEFLELGGSECWSGNLDEMRKDRLDYGIG